MVSIEARLSWVVPVFPLASIYTVHLSSLDSLQPSHYLANDFGTAIANTHNVVEPVCFSGRKVLFAYGEESFLKVVGEL